MNNDDLTELLGSMGARAQKAHKARRYFDGEHDQIVRLRRDRRTSYDLQRVLTFRDNLMPGVVRALSSRLNIESWTTEHQEQVAAIAKRNRFAQLQKELVQEAVLGGDSAVVVGTGPDGLSRLYPQKAGSFVVAYSSDDLTRLAAALRVWVEGKRVRVSHFTDDSVTHLRTRKDGRRLPNKANELEVVDEEPTPNGVMPFFHFGNDADLGGMGRSELEPAIPIQDMLNLSIVNMKLAQEDLAYPMRVRIGAEDHVDPHTGEPPRPVTGPGTVQDVPLGGDWKQLPGADFRPFLEEQENLRQEIAAVTSTPLHMLALLRGQPPSGDALDVLEKALTDKARDRQDEWTGPWSDSMRLALHLDGVRPGEDEQAIDVEPVWASPESTSEQLRVELVEAKVAAGWSRKRALMEHGYSDSEAEELIQERASEEEEAAIRRQIEMNGGGFPEVA